MPTYKTKDGIDRILPGIGRTKDGFITTDIKIENPMFEMVSEGEAPAQAAQAATADPAAPAVTPTTSQVGATPASPEMIIEQTNKGVASNG